MPNRRTKLANPMLRLFLPSGDLAKQLPANPDVKRDTQFLITIGWAQVASATLRMIISLLSSVGASTASILPKRLLTTIASFVIYSLTGCAILLTCRVDQLIRLKRRATGTLVLCSLSAAFAVYDMNQQFKKIADEAFGSAKGVDKMRSQFVTTAGITTTAPAKDRQAFQRNVQHRAVVVTLLLVQFVILGFAAYLCVKLIWAQLGKAADAEARQEAGGKSASAIAEPRADAARPADAEEAAASTCTLASNMPADEDTRC